MFDFTRDSLNHRQIRAARALLDWSQDDLAEASGLSIATIRKIESGAISPRDKTTESIATAFSDAGIEFTPGQGVRLRENDMVVIEGPDVYLRALDDCFHTLKDKGGELLVWYADNSLSPQEVLDSEARMINAGIRIRFIVAEGDTYLTSPLEEYRWVPKAYFHNNVVQIYGDKVALSIYPNLTAPHPAKIVIFTNRALAEALRNAFNFMWENCRKPTFTTAKTQRVTQR